MLMLGGYVFMREFSIYRSLRATHKHISFGPLPTWKAWTQREVEMDTYDEHIIPYERLGNERSGYGHEQPFDDDSIEIGDLNSHLFALAVGIPIVGCLFMIPIMVRRCLNRAGLVMRRVGYNNVEEVPPAVVHVGGIHYQHMAVPQRRVRRQPVFGEA
jgi:hypothetical protein